MHIDFEYDSVPTMAYLYLVRYWEYILGTKTELYVILEVRSTELPLLLEETVEEGRVRGEGKVFGASLVGQVMILETPILDKVLNHWAFAYQQQDC